MTRILIVDDDRDLVEWLGYIFKERGYQVISAYNGETALTLFKSQYPDIILLDLALPRRSGMDVLQEIREQSQVPVILVSAAGDEEHIVQGIQTGADDYVVKPFRPRELWARAEGALRRRKELARLEPSDAGPLVNGDLSLDPKTRQAIVKGNVVHLTPTEYAVLEYLMMNRDKVLTLSDIYAKVWGYSADQGEDVVRLSISRLRRKIEPDPAHPRYIFNVPGHGYVVRSPRA